MYQASTVFTGSEMPALICTGSGGGPIVAGCCADADEARAAKAIIANVAFEMRQQFFIICHPPYFVIPGRAESTSPESIATKHEVSKGEGLSSLDSGYGFRARRFAAPRN